MKRFICKICFFFIIVAIVDVTFGNAMEIIIKQIDKGGTGRDNYICDIMTDDVAIFGSSRAERHYNAQMISDSLGMSCYNAGESGCGIILAYGRLLMLLERYTPKLIIYEVTPVFDYLYSDNQQFLYRLKQRYDRPGIDSIFEDIDPSEKYKMISRMYRHNSSFLQNLIAYFFNIPTKNGVKGFRPINEEMDTMRIRKDVKIDAENSENDYIFDSLKIHYFEKFLEKSKKSNLIFVCSPIWYGQDTLVLKPIKDICQRRNIRLLDFSNSPKYVHHNEFFKDGTHLNARGADEFTKDLIRYLRAN